MQNPKQFKDILQVSKQDLEQKSFESKTKNAFGGETYVVGTEQRMQNAWNKGGGGTDDDQAALKWMGESWVLL